MLKGLLIYEKSHGDLNKSYIDWLIAEARQKNMTLELVHSNQGIFVSNEVFEIDTHSLQGVDFVINRSRDHHLSRLIEMQGIRVFNTSAFSYLGNDKVAGYTYAKSVNVPFAPLFTQAHLLKDKSKRYIEKPILGHGGIGIHLVEHFDQAEPLHQKLYQEWVKNYIGDLRVYIINNQIEASIIRIPQNGSLTANYSSGGHFECFTLSESQKTTIERLLSNITIDYGSADFLVVDQDLLFNEFEDVVGSRMLSALGINSTTEHFFTHILNCF